MNRIVTHPISNEDSPIDFLWKHKDVMIVAPGSGPCVRGLYARAYALDKLHQFMYCNTTPEDYILGNVEDKIRSTVLKSATISGVQVIIIYLSCLDILINLDFEELAGRLSAETGLLVKSFLRGPLAKKNPKYIPPEKYITLLPEEKCEIPAGQVHQLPPAASDLAGIADLLRYKESMNALIAPKGCRICLRDSDLTESQLHQYVIESGEKDYIFGFEQTSIQQIVRAVAENNYKNANVISSAIPAFVGFDGEWVMNALESQNITGFQIPADGFNDAVYGVSCASEMIVKFESLKYKETVKEVLVTGYSPLLCGDKGQYAEQIAYIESLGYGVRFLGEKRGGKPALCWVVSTAGIRVARKLNEKWEIPVLISCPVGEHASQMWKKNVKELLAGYKETRMLCIHNHVIPETNQKKLLFIGDPVHTMALAHECWHRGFHHIKLAAFARYPETAILFKETPGAGEYLTIVEDIETLKALWQEADIVIADPQLRLGMPEKAFLPFPWGVISGRNADQPGSGVLGKNILQGFDEVFA